MLETKQIRLRSRPTYRIAAFSVAGASNKPMVGLFNAGISTKIVSIWGIWIRNVQTAGISGIWVNFETKRITGVSGHTVLTPESMDTTDTLSNITGFTAGTVSGEAAGVISRRTFTSEEAMASGNPTISSSFNVNQAHFQAFTFGDGAYAKPLVVRPNQGFMVALRAASGWGTWDLEVEFTTE